jgi:NhaP-type Na+/H+ or K+/H+ antiporter
VVKGLLAVVWVIIGALAGALVGVAVGFVTGAAVSTLEENSSPNGDDMTAIVVGSMAAVGCAVIGAIAGAAGAIVWAIDSRGRPEREARFGDRPEDFR